jgi:hypothetical protein
MKKILMTTVALLALMGTANAETRVYERVYDAQHLAKHPNQTVTAMRLILDDEERDFTLAIRVRGKTTKLVAVGFCSQFADTIGYNCTVDCPNVGVAACKGGGFVVTEAANKSILLRLKFVQMTSDDGKQIEFTSGIDDDVFRLYYKDKSPFAQHSK